jgi:hypothetical protein
MYECHGWTDKFQLFQFQFSRIQSSKSVRPYGGPEPKKKLTDKHKQTEKHTDPIGGNTFNGKKFALNLFNGKKIKRPMAQFKSKHAVLLTLRSVSMQCT